MKILLTGGNGFIGKNILEKLGNKYTFFAPTRQELEITNSKAVENFLIKYPVDVVIHSAKYGGTRKIPDSPEIAELNTQMFFNIVRCEKYFKKMIFLGSGSEYDNSRPLKKIKEENFDEIVPRYSFAFSKYLCSKYIEKASNILNLRIFGIYGKYEDYELRFISNAICKHIFGLPITIRQNVVFDYVYIDDFVTIIDYFMKNNAKNKFYNIGRNLPIDLLSIAKLINEIGGKEVNIKIGEKGLKNEYTCDATRLRKEINNLQFIDFETSLQELYEWYKSIKNSLSINSFLIDK